MVITVKQNGLTVGYGNGNSQKGKPDSSKKVVPAVGVNSDSHGEGSPIAGPIRKECDSLCPMITGACFKFLG